jgi:hypothetical protein
MTYAGFELCLHVTGGNIFLFFILFSLRNGFLFLPDIREVHPELLQLTAGDTNHRAVDGWESVIKASPWDSSKTLEKYTNVIMK